MSDRRSRSRQPPAQPPVPERSTGQRLAAAAGPQAADAAPLAAGDREPPLVPLCLALLLGGLVLVMATGAHLTGAAGLAPWLTPSPLPAGSPTQAGKLVVHAGLAIVTAGSLLLVRQAARRPDDRRLTARFAWLLLAGGGLYVGLDLAPALGLRSPWIGLAEATVKWAVLGGCGLLLAHRLRRRPR